MLDKKHVITKNRLKNMKIVGYLTQNIGTLNKDEIWRISIYRLLTKGLQNTIKRASAQQQKLSQFSQLRATALFHSNSHNSFSFFLSKSFGSYKHSLFLSLYYELRLILSKSHSLHFFFFSYD